MASPPTTVVVARTARAGRDAEAQRWLDGLFAAARNAPGFAASEVQQPGAPHPDEWVVVYEFETRDALTAWLGSDERAAIRSTEHDLFIGPAREQIIAAGGHTTSVTGVSSFRLRTPRNEVEAATASLEFDQAYDGLVEAIRPFPGLISCDLFPPEPGVQDEAIVVFSFETRAELDDWFASDERAEALARLEPLLDDSPTTNVVGGFAGWFAPSGGRPVPTWKQASLVLLALYPTALVIGALRDAIAPDLPGPVATLIGNAGGVLVLSWFLMPVLTRRFQAWLHR